MTFVYYYIKDNCISSLSMTPGVICLHGYGVQKSFKCSFELKNGCNVFVVLDKKNKNITNIMSNDCDINSYIENTKINYEKTHIYCTNICKEFWYR